ncbi:heme acquisition protein HasA [Gibbsiella greigii]
MSFSIQYDTDFASYTIAEYLDEWATLFGDSNHTSGNVDDNNSGGFWGETNATYGGTQYSLTSTVNNTTAFIAEGDLVYEFSTHTLTGTVDSLDFGEDLQLSNSTGYSLQSLEVTFNGLADIVTDVHDVIYGLMRGDVSYLLDSLETAGIDTNATLETYAATAAALTADSTTVDVVGVADSADLLLAA